MISEGLIEQSVDSGELSSLINISLQLLRALNHILILHSVVDVICDSLLLDYRGV